MEPHPTGAQTARWGAPYGFARSTACFGADDNERNLRNKVNRGTFTAGLLLQCLTAMGAHAIRLDE